VNYARRRYEYIEIDLCRSSCYISSCRIKASNSSCYLTELTGSGSAERAAIYRTRPTVAEPSRQLAPRPACHDDGRHRDSSPGPNGISGLSNFRPRRQGHYGCGAYWRCRSSSKECRTTDKFHRRVLEGSF